MKGKDGGSRGQTASANPSSANQHFVLLTESCDSVMVTSPLALHPLIDHLGLVVIGVGATTVVMPT